MTQIRIFPRYNTQRIQTSVHINNSAERVSVYNVSLCGVQLRCKNKVKLRNNNIIEIVVSDKQKYSLSVMPAWQSTDKQNKEEIYGCKIKFFNKKDYDKWLIFIKALHQLNNKVKNNDRH